MKGPRSNGHAPPPKRTQSERNEEAERRLLDAALRIVAEKGTARMTLADVGDLSGYSRSLASHYFGSKTGLLLALVEHVRKVLQKQMRPVPKPAEGLDTVLAMVGTYLRPSRELSVTQRALFALRIDAMQVNSEISDHMADHYRESEAFVERQLRLGIERGEIRGSVDSASQALVILCSMHGIISQWLANPHRVDLALVREEMLKNLRRSLQPAKGKPTKTRLKSRKRITSH